MSDIDEATAPAANRTGLGFDRSRFLVHLALAVALCALAAIAMREVYPAAFLLPGAVLASAVLSLRSRDLVVRLLTGWACVVLGTAVLGSALVLALSGAYAELLSTLVLAAIYGTLFYVLWMALSGPVLTIMRERTVSR